MTKTCGELTLTTPADTDIVMTREFKAPRRLVYRCMTEPELMKRWFLGPDGWELATCEMDVRVGGKYRWEWKKTSTEYVMGCGGVFLEIDAPERMVQTERFDQAWYAGEAVNTTVLTEQKGKTLLTLTCRYTSKEVRDEVLKTPMETGVERSYERLSEMLATMD